MRRMMLSVAVMLAVCAGSVWADETPAPQADASAAASTAPAMRSARDILSDLDAAAAAFDKVAPPTKTFYSDAEARQKAAPAMLPPMKKLDALMVELGQAAPEYKESIESNRYSLLAMRTLMGDAAAQHELDTQKAGSDAAAATRADLALSSAQWWAAPKDAATQRKVLDHLETLAKAQPENAAITGTLLNLSAMGAATPELAKEAEGAAKNMSSALAKKLKEQDQKEAEYTAAFADKIGKPFAVQTETLDGKKLNTADWKGKVVVINFWATWCPPCRAEMPDLAAMYKKLHGEGLEMLGVSADDDEGELKSFLKDNSDVTWPMVFSDSRRLITDLGVEVFPTTLIIDREGNLRKVLAHMLTNPESELAPYMKKQ